MLLLNIACCKVTIIYWIIANLAARKDFYRYSMTMHLLNVQPTSKRNVHQEGLCLACACCQHPLPVWLQYYKVYTLAWKYCIVFTKDNCNVGENLIMHGLCMHVHDIVG